MNAKQSRTADSERPFVVPCAALTLGAPFRWLRLGWQDYRRAPALSLFFGVAIFLASVAVSATAYVFGNFALLAALLSGFVFLAPLIAAGLYCVARQHDAGQQPRLRDSWILAKRVVGQAGVFALAQMVILMIWARSGMMLNALFPIETGEFQIVVQFLLLGSAIGSVFAVVTFATAVFSLPMIADRDVDMITGIVSSVNAVLRNKTVCLLWAALIVGLTLIGFATAFLGLIVIMPWLAYAAWHAYQDALDASVWPRLQ